MAILATNSRPIGLSYNISIITAYCRSHSAAYNLPLCYSIIAAQWSTNIDPNSATFFKTISVTD